MPQRLRPKLDIVEEPENRVHRLTDFNGTRHHVNDKLMLIVKYLCSLTGDGECVRGVRWLFNPVN